MKNCEIRARPAPTCTLCNTAGRALYSGLRDRLFAAPGVWSLLRCMNEACGLIWLNPMPIAEDLENAYVSYYTHESSRTKSAMPARFFAAAKRGYIANHFGYVTGARAFERLLGLLPWLYPGRPAELDFSVMWLALPRAGARLLDVGAGNGWLVEHMRTLGWNSEGLDLDPAAVEKARSKGLKMHVGGLVEQRFEPQSFDAVTLSHSIEHVPDPVALLREVRKILRPDGLVSIATPNARSLLHRGFRENWFALDPPRHLHLFNRSCIAAALASAGFNQPRIFTTVRDANGAFLGSRAIRKRGRYEMMAGKSVSASAAARLVQLCELLVLSLDRDAGEDLVAIATC